jgi:hypothetical protein
MMKGTYMFRMMTGYTLVPAPVGAEVEGIAERDRNGSGQ